MPTSPFKEEKLSSLIRELTADFIQRESSGKSMITITRVRHLGRKVVFLCSVLPESETDVALDFLKRKRTELHRYLQNKARIHGIPPIDFEIDTGA